MKKLFAATLAAIFILSAAGCAKKPVQQEEPAAPVQEEAIVPEAPAEAEKSQDNVIHITPNQNQTQDGLEASWLDEPERIQTDLEEIVSCTYTLPHLTLESDDASAAANAVFDELSQTVISYAQETVYPAAQEKAAIGYVNGGYSISEVDGTLVVDYTLSVSYSTETSNQQFTHIYTIDLSTGELLKDCLLYTS